MSEVEVEFIGVHVGLKMTHGTVTIEQDNVKKSSQVEGQ